MLKQTEGSQAVAEAVALCRPEVICAYPITPQTHIVEKLGQLVKNGALENCEFVNVESEFAALSVAIGASATGARAYTATASQGLLFMAEAVYNASGLGLPIVMTIGNRAIGAPINIWNDQQDSMSMRDAGWIQLYAETNQEAVDLHIQAFRLAEELSVPVMVCMDGFILTHACERLDIPSQEQVDVFLPPFSPRQILDPQQPVTIGAMVGPEAFTEVRYLAHYRQMQALVADPGIGGGVRRTVRTRIGWPDSPLSHGRCRNAGSGPRVCQWHHQGRRGRDAGRRCVDWIGQHLLLPSVPEKGAENGPEKSQTRAGHRKIARRGYRRDCVNERSHGIGRAGCEGPYRYCRPRWARDHQGLPRELFDKAGKNALERLNFLDLNHDVIHREIERLETTRLSGPIAENILRELGAVADHIG